MERPICLFSLWLLISIQLGLAIPIPIQPRAISAYLLATFNLFEQYAAAPYCDNNVNSVGTKLTCSVGNCPLVQADNTTTLDEFQNSHAPVPVRDHIADIIFLVSSSLFTDVTGLVAVDSDRKLVVVSFRGSVSVRNWLNDFDFPQVSSDICIGCFVHQGWWSAWYEARASVLSSITGICDNYPGYQLVVTGHSAGGAIGTLAAAELRKMGYTAVLYTFGAPRIGGPTVSQFITNQLGGNYRVTHFNDPVPNIPPILFGYDHISPEYWITSGNNVAITANNIQVCSGLTNIHCNAGQIFIDVNAHLWYFNAIASCETIHFEFKA